MGNNMRKRLYRGVSVTEGAGQYLIAIDDEPIRTPAKALLTTPYKRLAEAVVEEWENQGSQIDTQSMPLTKILNTLIDRVIPERVEIIQELVVLAETDLLCYRASHPLDLRIKQDTVWQPVLDWLLSFHGVGLAVAEGVMPLGLSGRDGKELKTVVSSVSSYTLTIVQLVAANTGSLALGLAFAEGRLTAAETLAAAQLDEIYQMETWGEDIALLAEHKRLEGVLLSAERFLHLVRH